MRKKKKKTSPTTRETVTIVERCETGFHVQYLAARPKIWEHNITPAEIVDHVRISKPDRVHLQLDHHTLGMLAHLTILAPEPGRVAAFSPLLSWDEAIDNHPSCGGLRPVTGRDEVVAVGYQLLTCGTTPDDLDQTLSRHPAWAYLTFPAGHDKRAAAELLTGIVDPRFYVQPDCPNAISPLRKYLGIPRHPGDVSKSPRYVTLCKAWGHDANKVDLNDPAAFLHRHRRDLRMSGSTEAEADVKVSARYVAYLQKAWLEAIRQRQGEPIFNPQLVMDSADAVAALKTHVAAVDGRVLPL